MVSSLLTFIAVAAVAAILIGSSIASRRRATVETGLVPVYEQMCSGRIGLFMGANFPAIRLSLYDTFLVVAFFSPVVVPYKDIVLAETQRELFSRRVAIRTKNGAIFRLSVRDPEYVLKLLKRT